MKKILSILLITLTALTANMFNTGAQNLPTTPGQIMFKFNIKDFTSHDPLQGVEIVLHMRGYKSKTDLTTVEKFDFKSNKSDNDGVAYIYVPYSADGTSGGWINNHYFWSPTGHINLIANQFVDFDGLNSYNWHIPLVAGYVRNLRPGYTNMTRVDAGTHDNCYLSHSWVTAGAAAEFDVYFDDPTSGSNRTITFDTSTISNDSDFSAITVAKGTTVNAPATPEHANGWTFEGWTLDDGTDFNFPVVLTSNITLKPKWSNPNRQGKINFEVFRWDHDKYITSPKTYYPQYGQGYTHEITGQHGNKVMSNFELSDYWTNAGWTDTKVCNLRFTVRTYPHQAGAPDNPRQIGEITTDENGEATLTLSSSELDALEVGYIIDTDPDPTSLGYIDMETELGTERLYCVFNYDWIKINVEAGQNAGLVGVRYIPEGTRHDDLGIQLGNYNDNDAMRITANDKDGGFEFTFRCYVLPAPCAQFDVNGGTMPAGYDPTKYPQQRFNPINSAGVDVKPWIVEDPCTGASASAPTPPAGYEFEGWHEVRTTLLGAEYVDPKPYNFGNTIKRSVVLRAIYGIPAQEYTVRWAPEGWAGSDSQLYEKTEHHKDGSDATYNVQLPTATGKTFIGWDLYKKVEGGTTSFGTLGGYEFDSTIYQPQQGDSSASHMQYIETSSGNFWLSPISVRSDQIYVAKFETIQTITVVKTGLEVGDSAIFTLTKGTDSRQIVLTNTGSGSASETVQVSTGEWTVTEDMDWTWAYTNSDASTTVTVNAGDQKTVTFANTSKSTTPKHGEGNAVNTFNK